MIEAHYSWERNCEEQMSEERKKEHLSAARYSWARKNVVHYSLDRLIEVQSLQEQTILEPKSDE